MLPVYQEPGALNGASSGHLQDPGAVLPVDNDTFTAPIPPPSFKSSTQQENWPTSFNDREASEEILSLTTRKVLSQKSVMNQSGIPFGGLVTPLPVQSGSVLQLTQIERPPYRCLKCGAYLNRYCKVDSIHCSWHCVLCLHVNPGLDPGLAADIQRLPEMQLEAVEYVRHNPQDATLFAAPVLLLLDGTVDASDIQTMKEAVMQVLRVLPDQTHVALIMFASAISVFRLSSGDGSMAAADMVSGRVSPSDAAMEVLEAAVHVAPLGACREHAMKVVEAMRPLHQSLATRERPRCLGVAVEVAMKLASKCLAASGANRDIDTPTAIHQGHVLCVTTGPTTKGPGAVPFDFIDGSRRPQWAYLQKKARNYFDMLGGRANSQGVVIDVVGGGVVAINAAFLAGMTTATGGLLLEHEGFGPLFGANLAAAATRRHSHLGALDIRTSPFLKVVDVMGAVAKIPHSARERIPNHAAIFSKNAHVLNCVEVGQGAAFFLGLSVDFPEDSNLFLQVSTSWRTFTGAGVERVVTRLVATTTNMADFLNHINCTTSAAVISKRLIAFAQSNGAAYDRKKLSGIQKRLGRHVYWLASRFGVVDEGHTSWFGNHRMVLPRQLTPLVQALYHLQRGPMVGMVGHPDEKALRHAMFVNAAGHVVDRAILPVLWLLDYEEGMFTQLPPVDLALSPDASFVLDVGTEVLIWLGANLAQNTDPGDPRSAPTVQQRCLSFATEISQHRFPIPELRTVVQGTGDARYVISRLMPTHRDSAALQKLQCPFLFRTPEAVEKLSEVYINIPPTDEDSFEQWCRKQNILLDL